MSKIIEDTLSLAHEFVANAEFVSISDTGIDVVAHSVKKWIKEKKKHQIANWYPKCINPKSKDAVKTLFLYELIASSVNYCYWFGKHTIRPIGANSSKMYDLLDASFLYLMELKKKAQYHPHHELEIIIGDFCERISRERFPLIDQRIRHLTEILKKFDLLSMIEISVQREDYNIHQWLDYIITSFPGFSRDLFLKRTFLFIMQMHRRIGIFDKGIKEVPVPADYQVPKILRMLGCIGYAHNLADMVDNNLHLPENSPGECEIRAATIVACKEIADLADCSCEQVDSYLWNRRNECSDPFHLTITSNY